jgi:hypothetical protein
VYPAVDQGLDSSSINGFKTPIFSHQAELTSVVKGLAKLRYRVCIALNNKYP